MGWRELGQAMGDTNESFPAFTSSPVPPLLVLTTILVLAFSTFILLSSSQIYFSLLSLKARLKGGLPPPPGSSGGFPIVGELFDLLENPSSFITSRHKKYGPVFRSTMLGTTVFLEPPSANKMIQNAEGKLVESFLHESFQKLVGANSFALQYGETHRLARRHLLPFFKPSALAQYVPRFVTNTKRHLEKFWQGPPRIKDGQEFELPVLKLLRKLTYSGIMDLVLGAEEHEKELLEKSFEDWIDGFFSVPLNFPGFAFRRACTARATFLAFFEKIMLRRREELAAGKANPTQDTLSFLLTAPKENGELCTDEEIKDDLLAMLIGGQETMASVLAMAFRFISLNPDVKRRLQEEHDAVAKSNNGGDLTFKNVSDMKYTRWVIQEVMRCQAPVPMATRKVLQDFDYGGFTIQKDWKVVVNFHQHMDSRWFKDPEKFDPTRFNGETEIIPGSYVPFGGGVRVCPGQDYAKVNLAIVIYLVMQNYTFTIMNPDERVVYSPVATYKSGMPMKVKKLISATG